MASHGAAYDQTILDLENCTPFQRRGYGLSLVTGKWSGSGRLQGDALKEYYGAEDIAYTALSYGTPIAWVLQDGNVIVPEDTYSTTTSQHQRMCREHLNVFGRPVK